MAKALVVDDVRADQRRIGGILERKTDLEVAYASNGKEALDAVARELPALVLTDIQMPEMDGLQLMETIRERHPGLPVILMTGSGSEAVAAQALRRGATSYVPKNAVPDELLLTVKNVRAATKKRALRELARESLVASQLYFVIDNDLARIPAVIGYLRDGLAHTGLCDEADQMQVGVALDEALSNAVHHGNLEVDSALREESIEAYLAEIERRARIAPWSERRVHVTARFTREEAVFVVRDEGDGFDVGSLPDPTDPANLERASGRGLLLIRTFMDEVSHNETGNELTMIKRAAG